ncbi:MAG: STAS domain-containing protein [Lachnospiraceae bacterium]
MNISKTLEGTELTIALTGRLDTTTAPELEKEVKDSLDGVTKFTLDLAKLEYISSAGLRVLLGAQKVMNKQGEMTVTNVSSDIQEIFDVTGFCDILNIQ